MRASVRLYMPSGGSENPPFPFVFPKHFEEKYPIKTKAVMNKPTRVPERRLILREEAFYLSAPSSRTYFRMMHCLTTIENSQGVPRISSNELA